MSLINDALKKAQPQRSTDDRLVPEQTEATHYKPQKKKKNYLWGFLLAVIIVGLFSAAVTSFLVYQILGDEKGAEAGPPKNVVAEEGTETGQKWKKMASAETPAAEEPPVASPQPPPFTQSLPQRRFAASSARQERSPLVSVT